MYASYKTYQFINKIDHIFEYVKHIGVHFVRCLTPEKTDKFRISEDVSGILENNYWPLKSSANNVTDILSERKFFCNIN